MTIRRVLFAITAMLLLPTAACDDGSARPAMERAGAKKSPKPREEKSGVLTRERPKYAVGSAAPPHIKPVAPPPPEGEPTSNEDFEQLSETAKRGERLDKPGAPPIERVDENRFRIGQVVVDRQARSVTIPARLNMIEGILEYLAVASNGKLHEAVLELRVEPSHIHLGLVLIGLEPNVYKRDPEMGSKVVKEGSHVRIFVEWLDPVSKSHKRVPAEDWLYNRQTKKSPEPRNWIFQGSGFWGGRYGADQERSVVALVPDGSCVVGSIGDEGNPYRGEMLGFEVNKQIVPPIGTSVNFILEAAPKPKPTLPPPEGAPVVPLPDK